MSYLAQLAATALSRSSSISSAAPTPPTQPVSPVSPVALAAGTNENAHLLEGELNFIASPSSPLTGSESEGSSPAGQHPIAWLDIDDGTSVPLYRLRRTYAIPRSPISAEERARNEEWFRNRDRQLSPSANSNNTLARAASAASTHGSSGENNPATPPAAWRQATQPPLNHRAPRRPLNGSPVGVADARILEARRRNLQAPFARAFQEEAAAAASAAQAAAQQLRSDSQLASVSGQAPASVSPSALEQATQQAAQAEQAVTVLASLANTGDASTAGASAASAASSQAHAPAAGSLPQKRGRGHDGGEGGDQKRR